MSKVLYYIIVLFGVSFSIQTAEQTLPEEPPAKRARVEDPRGPELVEAVRENDFETMQKLLEQGVSILTRSAKGSSLLNIAIGNGNKEIFYYLMENGLECDVNFQNNEGTAPFHLAAQFGQLEEVRFLLKKGALVETRHNSGATALLLAVLNSHLPVVKLLIEEHQACVNTTNNNLNTPLIAASCNSDYAMVEFLLEHKAQVDLRNDLGATALFYAAQAGNFRIVQRFLERGADSCIQTNNGQTALMAACQEGSYQITQLLLNQNPDIVHVQDDDHGRTALFFAAYHGHDDIVQLLLERGADMRKHLTGNDLDTPLYVAAENGHLSVIKVIEEFERENGRSIINFHGFDQAVWTAFDQGKNNVVAYLANKVKEAGHPIAEQMQHVIDEEDQGIITSESR